MNVYIYPMKAILVSLDEKHEKKLRLLAKELNGGKKGALSETVMEAIDTLDRYKERQKAWKRLWELSNENQDWGIGTFKREDAYDDPRFG
jgi:hypothetical protein